MNRSDDTVVILIPHKTWGALLPEDRDTIIAYSMKSRKVGNGLGFLVGRSRVEEIEQLLSPSACAGAEQTPPA